MSRDALTHAQVLMEHTATLLAATEGSSTTERIDGNLRLASAHALVSIAVSLEKIANPLLTITTKEN